MGISDEDLALDEAARLLTAAAVEAGKLALSMREGVHSWKKDANSPVSDADIAVDNFLRERLLALTLLWLALGRDGRPARSPHPQASLGRRSDRRDACLSNRLAGLVDLRGTRRERTSVGGGTLRARER
jgi:hypothetical protein